MRGRWHAWQLGTLERRFLVRIQQAGIATEAAATIAARVCGNRVQRRLPVHHRRETQNLGVENSCKFSSTSAPATTSVSFSPHPDPRNPATWHSGKMGVIMAAPSSKNSLPDGGGCATQCNAFSRGDGLWSRRAPSRGKSRAIWGLVTLCLPPYLSTPGTDANLCEHNRFEAWNQEILTALTIS